MDLTTTYMGLDLKNPLVPSASPLSQTLEGIKRMEDAGASAVVMFSLFEEQLQRDAKDLADHLDAGTDSFAEALSYFPEVDDYKVGPDEYLKLISQAAEQTDIPIIASLNGVSNEGWTQYAKEMQDAGAKGIELNVYYIPTDLTMSGRDVEERYISVLKSVKNVVDVPVAIKLSPFFSSIGNMAKQFDDAGADALVLFNRFYQPDFDIENLSVEPSLNLSTSVEIRLPLLWIAVLYGKLQASLGATRGVHSGVEILKYLMAGADVAMVTSVLMKRGVSYISVLLDEMKEWMEKKEYSSVKQMKGSMSQQSVADPTAFERGNYIKILEKYKAEYTLS